MVGILQHNMLSTFQRQALFLAALTVVAALAFLALLSVRSILANAFIRSRAHPY